MKIKSNNDSPFGAGMTLSLLNDRLELIESYAVSQKKMGLLLGGSRVNESVRQKIEIAQLNEILRPYALSAVILKHDLYSRIVKRTILELKESGLIEDDSPLLTEGFWDSVQSGIGNFAGGVDKLLKKLKLKKEPKGWEQAQAVFKKIATQEGDKVVQDLVKAIESEVSELESGLGSKDKDQQFPSNKNANVFFSGLNTIASTYDTIVAATKKDPGEEGYMPPEVANEIIRQLRIVVQKYMADTEREKGGMYATFGAGDPDSGLKATATGEGDDKGDDLLQEEDEENEAGQDTGEEINPEEEYEKIMSGKDSPVFQRMTSLKAPLVIAGIGTALGTAGWVANQPWFQDFILKVLDIPKTTDIAVTDTKEVLQNVEQTFETTAPDVISAGKPTGGLAKTLTDLSGGEVNLMGKGASLEDLKGAAQYYGGGDVEQGLQNISGMMQGRGKPDEALKLMRQALEDPSSFGAKGLDEPGSAWKLFSGGTARGGGIASHAKGGIFSVHWDADLKKNIIKKTIQTITKQVPRKIATKTVKQVGTTGAASVVATLTGAAPILAGIGLSTVVAGAALAAIRQRGKTKSRMGAFNSLLQVMDFVPPAKAEDVEPEGESVVTITLNDPGSEVKSEASYVLLPLLFETTSVEITGLSGNEELEKTGGVAKFTLDPVDIEIPPKVDSLDQIPYVIKGINDILPDLDLGAPNVTVRIVDKRTAPDIPENPPKDETPPVAFTPAQIAKGSNAVVVFDPQGAKVWRILKKKTFQKYASDAKKSGDKDAPEFAERYAKYDGILSKLRADGVFVNSDALESELSKISSGQDGAEHRVSYTRTRGDKKRKSTTGGYTKAGKPGSISDIRSNIKGAPGSRPPRDAGDMTIIYLISNDVIQSLVSAGLDEDEAKKVANNAIATWAKSEKRPKVVDLGVKDEKVSDALKAASLAESKHLAKHKVAVIEVGRRKMSKILAMVAESYSGTSNLSKDRWAKLSGIA